MQFWVHILLLRSVASFVVRAYLRVLLIDFGVSIGRVKGGQEPRLSLCPMCHAGGPFSLNGNEQRPHCIEFVRQLIALLLLLLLLLFS
jgi:hypothetical protein